MIARAYVTVWIVAWASCPAATIVGAKVTRCCPRDMILAIDTFSCTGFVADDKGQHESYAWSSDDDSAAATAPADFAFSVSNSNSIPWSVMLINTYTREIVFIVLCRVQFVQAICI